MRQKKTGPVRLTHPYPTLKKMAKTYGASKKEVREAKRLVEKAMGCQNTPVVLTHPYPTLEETRKALGMSKKRAAEIVKMVDEIRFKQIMRKYGISRKDVEIIRHLDVFEKRNANTPPARLPKKPPKRLLRSGRSI